MKTRITGILMATLFVGVCLGAGSAQAALLLEFKFDESGTDIVNSGSAGGTWTMQDSSGLVTDLHGQGLSGTGFDNTASTGMGNAGVGGRVIASADIDAVDSLQSLTITGWIKDPSTLAPHNGARVISKFRSGTPNNGWELLWGGNDGGLQLRINDGTANSTANAYAESEDEWVFFAAVWDGTSGSDNARFYVGTTNTPVGLVNKLTLSETLVTDNANKVTIGNVDTSYKRAFDGRLDNIRLYGSTTDGSGALTLEELESIRYFDVVTIPEPASLTLVLLGVGSLVGWRRRRYL